MKLKTKHVDLCRELRAAAAGGKEFILTGNGLDLSVIIESIKRGEDFGIPYVEVDFVQAHHPNYCPDKPAIPTWNGPEDGLLPVGTKVTIENPQGYVLTCDEDDWLGPQLKVVMNYRNDFGVDLVVVERDDGAAQVFRASMCRPIRTAEQLAAEEREKRVAEFAASIKLAGWEDPLILAAWLDGQGYRKQVQP